MNRRTNLGKRQASKKTVVDFVSSPIHQDRSKRLRSAYAVAMEAGWYQDPGDTTSERFHNGTAWTDLQREKKDRSQIGASNALLWVGVISAIVGFFIGLRPMPGGSQGCGSAWLPALCSPGVHNSASATSVAFILIAGAAIITAIAIRNRKP